MSRSPGFALLVCLTVATCGLPAVAGGDWHVSSDRARGLYARSAFMHGYMHGYEEGFHCADLDLQMARAFRDIRSSDKCHKGSGYQRSFGDKRLFETGYRKGLMVGYTDGFAGRAFRAVGLARQVAGDLLDKETAGLKPDRSFDDGFVQGYQSGQDQGLYDGRAATGFRTVAGACSREMPHSPAQAEKDYCDGFRRGYLLGYSDGYTNQQQSPAFARK